MPMEHSHIWLGRFSSKESVTKYFEEVFDENDEDREYTPINKFAADQGEHFLDHDWVEHSYRSTNNIRHLIHGHSYSSDYIDQVIEKASSLGIANANTFIMADVDEVKKPKSIDGQDYKLWYLGIFKCDI